MVMSVFDFFFTKHCATQMEIFIFNNNPVFLGDEYRSSVHVDK